MKICRMYSHLWWGSSFMANILLLITNWSNYSPFTLRQSGLYASHWTDLRVRGPWKSDKTTSSALEYPFSATYCIQPPDAYKYTKAYPSIEIISIRSMELCWYPAFSEQQGFRHGGEGLATMGLIQGRRGKKNLALRANDNFWWARLMISFLNLPALSPSQRLDIIIQVHSLEGLEDLFDRIVIYIIQNDKASISRPIFTWILYTCRSLLGRGLEESITSEPGQSKMLILGKFNIFNNAVLTTCELFILIHSCLHKRLFSRSSKVWQRTLCVLWDKYTHCIW